MEYTFTPAHGQEISTPSLAWLHDKIFEAGEEFWSIGSGAGGLSKQLRDYEAVLSISFKKDLGFVLQHFEKDPTDVYVAIRSTDHSKVETIFIGGDPWTIPVSFFVPKGQTWQAVEHFCKTGDRSPDLTWARLADQQWDSNFS